ncbi:MAG: hypothetical protein PHH01_00145 [Patescibacteria group bacterium]|nr:hypothetical protein [Patescibacteria group bacterium]MDD5566593.1 hypothetical protein [Patescibacteria group bacterium]
MVSIYNDIIKKAWRIIWRNKFLWFFGLFLVWIGQEVETLIRNYYLQTEGSLSLDSWRELFKSGFGGIFSDAWGLVSSTTLTAVVVMLVFVLLLILVVWLTVISVGGIIHSTIQAENGKAVAYNQAFAIGQKHFWKNLIVYLLAKIADYIFLILTGLVASLVAFGVIGVVVSVIMILLSFAVSLIIGFVAKYAACYVVARGQTLTEAVRSGWKLFIKNWLASIEMAVIIFVINFIVSLGLIIVLVIVSVPFLLLVVILSQGMAGASNVLLYVLTAIILLVTVFVGSVLSSFQFSAWVLFFLKLDQGKKLSKIIMWAERLAGRKSQPGVR